MGQATFLRRYGFLSLVTALPVERHVSDVGKPRYAVSEQSDSRESGICRISPGTEGRVQQKCS